MCIGTANLALFKSLLHINATLGCRAFNAIVAAFSLDILGLPSVLCFCNAHSYRHNFLERSPELQTTSVDLNLDQSRMHSSSKNPSGPFRPKMTSSFTKTNSLDNVHSCSDDPLSLDWVAGSWITSSWPNTPTIIILKIFHLLIFFQ